jgi:phosphonatase-like hydrolase
MKIELVVFDMAGTTVNDNDSVNGCLRQALEAAGVAVTAVQVNAVMGLPKPDAIRMLLERAGQPAPADRVAAVHDDFVARMLRFYAADPSVYGIPGAVETFQRLRDAGLRVALDTGFNRPVIDVILQRLGWRDGDPIDASIGSDEVPRGRPHPDMIHALMRRFGVIDPARVAKVGDTPADLSEGASAGCGLVVGVTEGTHTRAQLAPCPHTHLIANVAALPALLEELGAL